MAASSRLTFNLFCFFGNDRRISIGVINSIDGVESVERSDWTFKSIGLMLGHKHRPNNRSLFQFFSLLLDEG